MEGLLSLDDRAVDFFPGGLNPLYITHKDITVRSLLTMSSVAFNGRDNLVGLGARFLRVRDRSE